MENNNLKIFIDFMNKYKLAPSHENARNITTHQSWGNVLQGNFNIPNENIKEFTKLYLDCVKSTHLSIMETPREYGPIIIDIDLKYNESDRLYNDSNIDTIINFYNIAMNEFLNLDNVNYNFNIFEKASSTKINDNCYKDGFHVMVPEIYTNIETRHAIRNKVIELCIESCIFDNYIEKIDKIIDKSVIASNGWFLYGSFKPKGKKYKLTTIYDKNLIKNCISEAKYKTVTKYLSTYYNYDKYTKDKIISNVILPKSEENKKPIIDDINDEKTDKIIKLLKCLDGNRYNYNDWLNIGIIIFNETKNIDIWKNWSKDYKHYNEEEINKRWYSFNNNNINKLLIGSLIQFAKDDNILEYNKLFTNNIDNTNNINNNINDELKIFDEALESRILARHFKKSHGDKFINQNNKMYFFNGIYWKNELIKERRMSSLDNFIGDIYVYELLKIFQEYETNILKSSKNHEETILKLKNNKKYIMSLLSHKKRQDLINDLIPILENDIIQFDKQPYIFAFTNKYYDLRISEFIETKAEYYISITSGYDFIDKDETENIKLIDKIIDTIFPDEPIKNLYMSILSSGLSGIAIEYMTITNGGGGNGKSLINEFVECMMGNYSYVIGADVLLKSINTTGSNVEIALLNNKRVVFCREPDKNKNFSTATIKEITGGKSLNARLNYSNDAKTLLNLTFIVECNQKPKIDMDECSDAIYRRIIDIPFKSKFITQQRYNELDEDEKINTYVKNTYYKTLEFSEKYKYALFLLLTKYYKKFYDNKEEFFIPEEVENRNKEYLKDSDELLTWIEDKCEKTNNPNDIIKLKVIYNMFTCSDYFHNLNKIQKRQNCYKNFINKLQSNMFLKKYIKTNKKQNNDKSYIITNYKLQTENFNNSDNE